MHRFSELVTKYKIFDLEYPSLHSCDRHLQPAPALSNPELITTQRRQSRIPEFRAITNQAHILRRTPGEDGAMGASISKLFTGLIWGKKEIRILILGLVRNDGLTMSSFLCAGRRLMQPG